MTNGGANHDAWCVIAFALSCNKPTYLLAACLGSNFASIL